MNGFPNFRLGRFFPIPPIVAILLKPSYRLGDHRIIIIRLINNRAQGSSSPFPTFQPSELPQSYQRRLQIGCVVRNEPPYVLLAMDLRYGVDRREEMHQRVELRGNAIIIAFTVVDDVVVIRCCYRVRVVVGLKEE